MNEGPTPTAASSTAAKGEIGAAGKWISAGRYQVKVGKVKDCSAPGAMRTLGIEVEIEAKTDEFFVAPRHAVLYSGGTRFTPRGRHAPSDCAPLVPKLLSKGESATGFVVFDVPVEHDELVLHYQPVRWGGVDPVRVNIKAP